MTPNATKEQERLEALVASSGSLKEAFSKFSHYETRANEVVRTRVKKAHDSIAEAIAKRID